MRSIGNIISTYRKKNKLSQPELAELLKKRGFDTSYKSISRWETDAGAPSVTIFMEMCRLLGITDVYEEYFGTNPNNPLSELNDEGKKKASEYIGLLISSGMYQREDVVIPFTRTIRLFDMPASAGTGNIIDDDHFEKIEVGPEVPESADFGIRVTGDSMEPRFVNGQIVWVHQQEHLSNGEIGVFFLDGNAYIKKLEDNKDGLFLISLNTKYSPIPISKDDNFKVFGKVVG